ncbi:MAG: 5-amino-6-(5-phosphoribosylamino)uracil reductase [Asgard group archaeon]|nr:5-amino-6-(5-phosphoribosylamino)uracil reductase [Asgard group archaeon]
MKIIMHNSASLDMSIKKIPVDLGIHYEIVGKYSPDVYMFGSITALIALEEGLAEIEVKEEIPNKKGKPFWVIIDSKGKLYNKLHFYRYSSYSGKLIILISENTPTKYVQYLEDNNYDFIIAGEEFVDYQKALLVLEEKYVVNTILIDSGGKLNSYFIEINLIDEISLLISLYISGANCLNLFRDIKDPIKLELKKLERKKEYLWLVYSVLK